MIGMSIHTVKGKRIAITANTSWYLFNFRANTIKKLISEGYNVVAIAPEDTYSQKLKDLGCGYISLKIDQGGINPFKDAMTLCAILGVLIGNRFDAVLNFTPKNNIYFSLVARMFSIPVINNIAGLGNVFINGGIVRTVCRQLYRISQGSAAKIFFQNEEDRRMFLREIIPNYPRSVRLPGSGVDLQRFYRREAPDDGTVRFILVARMLYSKGIKQYVDCARILKQRYGDSCQFGLLGFLDVKNPTAVTAQVMAEWVEEGIIKYLGISDNVEREIATADCVVLPSFYREGVPKSLLEAGAMGKPIITTDNVGCRETVNHEINGFICQPQNTESLLQVLDRMIRLSHQERCEMGKQSRLKMEKEFDESLVINSYISALNEVFSHQSEQAHQATDKPNLN